MASYVVRGAYTDGLHGQKTNPALKYLKYSSIAMRMCINGIGIYTSCGRGLPIPRPSLAPTKIRLGQPPGGLAQ